MTDHEPNSASTPAKPATRSAITVVLITVLLDAVSFSIIMPIMPNLIEELTGEGISHAATIGGWLLFVFAAVQFLSAPLLGALSDRYGRRPVEMLVTITFEKVEGGTKLTLRHVGIPVGPDSEGANTGWSQSFDKLAELVEERRR
jgi:uncharacterized protein YndB with AHSA1/START domain